MVIPGAQHQRHRQAHARQGATDRDRRERKLYEYVNVAIPWLPRRVHRTCAVQSAAVMRDLEKQVTPFNFTGKVSSDKGFRVVGTSPQSPGVSSESLTDGNLRDGFIIEKYIICMIKTNKRQFHFTKLVFYLRRKTMSPRLVFLVYKLLSPIISSTWVLKTFQAKLEMATFGKCSLLQRLWQKLFKIQRKKISPLVCFQRGANMPLYCLVCTTDL